MSSKDTQLTETQKRFLRTFLAQAGEHAIDKKFDLIRHGSRKYARWGQVDIAVNMSDEDLVALGRLGYLRVYTDPPAIAFTEKVLEEPTNKSEEGQEVSNKGQMLSLQVLRMDIIQVYAWLFASLLAAVFSLFLLWLTVQQALTQNISASIASAIMTAISSLLSGVFFRNYDKANEHLKYMRSKPPDTREQEIDK